MGLTQVSTNGVKDGSLLNADINASAAIAGTKISPNFGSQNIVTTGSITGNDLEIDSGTLSVDASNNRVGINETSPDYSLHVNSGSANSVAIFESTDTAVELEFKDSTGTSFLECRNDFRLKNSSGEKVRIDSAGRVGIGTSSPNVSGFNTDAQVLTLSGPKRGFIELRGNTQAADSIGGIRFFSANNLEAEILSVTDSNYNGDLRFTTNGSERMRIDTSGKIGIGITSPDQQLQVGGIIKGGSYIQTGDSGTASNNFHFGAEGDGTFRFYHQNYGAGNEKIRFIPTGAPILKVGGTTNTDLYNTSGTGNEGAWLVAGGASQFAASNSVICRMNRKTSNGKILAFYYNGSQVGTISTNANSLPSDRNFKTNISDLNLGLSLVKKLKPSQYNYKIDNENTPVMYGLIAQELEESLTSEGITKNSTQLIQHHPTDDSESDYDVDYTKLVPILINSIKELAAKVEALESK